MFDYIKLFRKVKKRANKQGFEFDFTFDDFIAYIHEEFMTEDVPPPEWMEMH